MEKTDLTEEEEIENDLEMEMLSNSIAKRCSRLPDRFNFGDEDAKEEIKEALFDIKKARILLKKYEDCLKKVKMK